MSLFSFILSFWLILLYQDFSESTYVIKYICLPSQICTKFKFDKYTSSVFSKVHGQMLNREVLIWRFATTVPLKISISLTSHTVIQLSYSPVFVSVSFLSMSLAICHVLLSPVPFCFILTYLTNPIFKNENKLIAHRLFSSYCWLICSLTYIWIHLLYHTSKKRIFPGENIPNPSMLHPPTRTPMISCIFLQTSGISFLLQHQSSFFIRPWPLPLQYWFLKLILCQNHPRGLLQHRLLTLGISYSRGLG